MVYPENDAQGRLAVAHYCRQGNNSLVNTARQRGSLTVVAVGSSTTQGVGASQPQYNYVSRLNHDLKTELPSIKLEVINAGIGGQTLSQILNRWQSDVIVYHPNVIILQTGINDAIQHTDLATFTQLLKETVLNAKDQGSFIAVMGNQYLGPDGSKRFPDLDIFNSTVQKVALETAVPYINRYDLLKTLLNNHIYKQNSLYDVDFLHASDFGYEVLEKCILNQIFGLDEIEKLSVSQ